jgi:AcrR family transcriptional regulator
MRIAAHEGFEAVSLGRLAGDLEMSKSGVLGPFGTMEELQAEAARAAIDSFTRAVWQPVEAETPGLPRLLALCDAWVDYLGGRSYVGGCFTSAEHHDSRLLRTTVADALRGWQRVLAADVRTAVAAGDVSADTDPDDVAFTINAIALGVGQARRMATDPQAPERARRAMRRALQTRTASARETAPNRAP